MRVQAIEVVCSAEHPLYRVEVDGHVVGELDERGLVAVATVAQGAIGDLDV